MLMKKSLGPKTIIYPTPAIIVGSYDKGGKPNGMTVAWAGICCSSPPCIAVSLRNATYTYGNIVERRAFTVNIPSEKYVKEVDYFGMVSGKNADKFSATGLTPVKSDLVDAPYIHEFPFILECRLLKTVEIGLHIQFIGEIMDIKADPSVLSGDGFLDIEKVRPILYAPEDGFYFGVGKKLGKAFSLGKDLK